MRRRSHPASPAWCPVPGPLPASRRLTYGALATPITFLLFYYFASMAIIIGAQFNNALLEYYPPKMRKREVRRWQRYDPERDAAAEVETAD